MKLLVAVLFVCSALLGARQFTLSSASNAESGNRFRASVAQIVFYVPDQEPEALLNRTLLCLQNLRPAIAPVVLSESSVVRHAVSSPSTKAVIVSRARSPWFWLTG